MAVLNKQQRLEDANYAIFIISLFGRRFFYSKTYNRTAKFELSLDGKLWIRDEYTNCRVLIVKGRRWRKFSNGGTLRSLVEALSEYIRTGEQIRPSFFGPWPDYVCDGDLWGYGIDEMKTVRNALWPRKCIAWPNKSHAEDQVSTRVHAQANDKANLSQDLEQE